MNFYLVLWSGGYEQPQLVFKREHQDAIDLANEWAKDAGDGDSIVVYEINPDLMIEESWDVA